MKSIDEDLLLCDMAETYGIIDPESLPVFVYARLAAGLRNNSRIKMKMQGYNQPLDVLLLALIFDKLNFLFRAEDGEMPKSLFEMLNVPPEEGKRRYTKGGAVIFDSVEDFERAWEE